jgi:uncharacterized membrane protein YuzA (DUF378 family)
MFLETVFMAAIFIVVVGAINLGVVAILNKNILEWIFGKNSVIIKILYGLMGLSALYLAFSRDTYLPFLGKTVIPCSILEERTPDHADTEVTVHSMRPGAKILFWAAEPATERLGAIKDWRRAYLDFANAGVTIADETGKAILRIRRPQPYTVPMKSQPLEAHVHWRVCGEDGFLGSVQTTTITGGPISQW